MENKYSRPKRRKHKDNPYTLQYCERTDTYKVVFKDGKGRFQCVEISSVIYKILDRFELDDLRELNEFDNHTEHSEVYEESLHNRAMDKPMELEDLVIQKATFEELHTAIKQLSLVQQKRIKMYYFDEMTVEEIAQIENTTHQAVSKSIRKGVEELKNILKN